jgi:UDP-2-acetamido-3-amino-2,3-dideoxy-glucuronate N-acetyltransferase
VDVLLVGFGRWGEQHLRVLRALGLTLWVADLAPARRAWAVGQGVAAARAVEDYRQALPHVQAVAVVTPADSHAAIAQTALAAGRHCFVEKPLALTSAEGRRLVAAAQAARRILQTGHIFRFHPVTAVLREALAGGRVGRVRYATGRFAGFKRPRTDVGVTQTDAIHYIDLFAYLLGRPATGVTAIQRDFLGRGLDDMSVTVVDYGEVPAIIEANYFAPGTWRECVIVGDAGTLVADYDASIVTLYLGEHRCTPAGWETVDTGKESLPVSGPEPLQTELAAFVAACSAGGPNLAPAEVGLAALEVVEAAAQAARQHRRIALDELRPRV